jgi:hypothetical protein
MRWLWLGGSITSGRENPWVSTHRLVIRALNRLNQDVEYLEPANHPAFVEGLREEGSGFYRAFLAEFPDIRYRRYDMPRAAERDVWLSREAALIDVLIVEAGAPAEVFSWLDRIDETSLVRVLLTDSGHVDGTEFDLVMSPEVGDVPYLAVGTVEEAEALATRLISAVVAERARSVPLES